MPEGFRFEWLIGVLLLSGMFFWISLLFSKHAAFALKTGWGWLEWRPLPHDLPRAMAWGFVSCFVLQQLFGLLVITGGLLEILPPGLFILFSILLFQGLLTFVLYRHLRRCGLDTLEVLGLAFPLRFQDVVWGWVGYCMCMPLVGLSSFLTKALFDRFQWKVQVQPMIEELSKVEGWLNWLSLFLLVGFIGPLLEEVVFRGFVFAWLRQKIGAVPGLITQALIFAVIHQHAASMLPLFSLALLLGLIYVYTRRLMPCVWAHALFNTLTLIYTMSGAPELPL